MYTLVFLTHRIAGMSASDFQEHYRSTHLHLASQMPGLISYQQSLIVHSEQPWAQRQPFDGYDALSLYTFESEAAARASFASPEGQLTNEDTPTFMHSAGIVAIATRPTRRFERSVPDQQTSQPGSSS